MKLSPYFIPLTEISLTWIKCVKTRPETIKLVEEDRENSPCYCLGKNFFGMVPRTQATKARINK